MKHKRPLKERIIEWFKSLLNDDMFIELAFSLAAVGVGLLIAEFCGLDTEELDVDGIFMVGSVAMVLLVGVGIGVALLVKKIMITKKLGQQFKDWFALNSTNMREVGWKRKLTKQVQGIVRFGTVALFVVSLINYIFMVSDFNKFYVSPRPDGGVTASQPFLKGTGGSDNFRIPAMVTLDDGTIISATDARWNHLNDSSGLDTIVSVSKDNGATWQYTFANYFGDNGNVRNDASTCFIDPALATDGQRAYMLVDVNPSGYAVSSSYYTPLKGMVGFDDQNRLLLRSKDSVKVPFGGLTYGVACHNANYDYCLDYTDNAKTAYGIYNRNTGERVDGYEVDLFFNITYFEDGEKKESNLFYHTSPYQVYPTSYLYLTSTTDGINWSAPTLLNLKGNGEEAILVGPGNGVYDKANDRLIFTCYYHNWYEPEYASLIWRDADGNWHRTENVTVDGWSSESTAVLIDENRVRVFYRGAEEVVCYTDMVFDQARGNYFRDPNATEVKTNATKTANCQMSSVLCRETYDGRQWIFVSTPTGKDRARKDGVIHAFALESDGSMTLVASRPVNQGTFAYSCLTQLKDGTLAIIYESGAGEIIFERVEGNGIWSQLNQTE